MPGAIILTRHGEPDISRKAKMNAAGYGKFWATYEVTGIVQDRPPPPELTRVVGRAYTFMSSTRLRSLQSATLLADGREFKSYDLLIEAPLPPLPWPSWLKMTPKGWGFVTRFWWWFFNHHGGQESRRQAEIRADEAAQMLEQMTWSGGDVVVSAHGFFNFMIGRALKKRGWRLAESQGFKYWSMRRFERR